MRSTVGPNQQMNGAKSSSNFKSPGGGDLDEHDYSLSVSDLGNSMYNSSRGPGLASTNININNGYGSNSGYLNSQ